LQNSSKNKWLEYLWLRSEILLITFIFLNLVFTAVVGFYTPRFINQFYASLNEDKAFNQSLWQLVALFGAEYLNRFLFQVSTHRYIQILLNHIRGQSYSLWLKAPLKIKKSGEHDDFPMGEVLSRLMNDTDAVREIVSSGSFGIFIDIIFIASSLVSFLNLNSFTGLGIFIAEVIAVYLLVRGSRAMGDIFMEVRKVTGKMARVVTDITSGLKELFFSPNNNYASKKGEKIFEEFLSKQLHANIWDAGYYSAAESLYPILIALLMIIIPYSKIVEVAILAALIDLIQRSITPIKDVASKVSVLARAKSGIDRVHQFNESFDHEVKERMDYVGLEVARLKLDLARFSYDQGFLLSDIHFDASRGQVLGIVGESGCGKSSLLKLLSGQFRTFDGSIQIDSTSVDPADYLKLRDFSSYVSLISQDSHVFTNTLQFNITLGSDQDFDHFWKLARREIIYLQSWGLSPVELINPQTLSMGQKQLISGLRALYLKKPIILMDEISSGLDSELEAALRDLIKFFQSSCITIIVTHRLETILNADQLLLLEQGRVLASGTPESLGQNIKFQEFLAHLK
jgi:ABC-type multidrug transport system fused ATPase/permease subunit